MSAYMLIAHGVSVVVRGGGGIVNQGCRVWGPTGGEGSKSSLVTLSGEPKKI